MFMKQKLTSAFILSIVLLVVAACGSESPEPEPVPTAEPLPTWTPRPTNEPAPTQEPTAIPTLNPSMSEQNFDWEPQPIQFSPAPGDETLLDGAITIRFDQPMDEASVEEAFAIQPAVDGQFSWPRPDLVIFTPSNQLEREQTYDVRLDATAKGQNGKALREDVKFQVQTVGALTVSNIIPADGTADVPTDGAITVLFNRPVVPLVATQDQDSLPFPIELNPQVPGKGEWISTSIFRFTPEGGFAGATTYQLSVPAGLKDVTGADLTDTATSSFSTIVPRVETVTPYEGSGNWRLEDPLQVTFNMPMNRALTEQAIGLNPAVDLSFEWSNSDRTVKIIPAQNLQIDTNYTLNVAQSAAPAGGQGGLDQAYQFDFATVPLPSVIMTEPSHRARNANVWGWVSVEFASPMDWSTLEDQLIIDPAPAKYRLDYSEGATWMGISFFTLPSIRYEITIPGTAADPYGNTLGDDYTWHFTTAESDPFLRLNIPFSLNMFSDNFAPQIDVRYLNINELDLRLSTYEGNYRDIFYGSWWNDQSDGKLVREWTRPVEDVQNEVGLVRLDLNDGQPLTNGIYQFQLTSEQLNYYESGRYAENRLLIVVDTNLVIKETVDGVYVWATDLASGQPAPGREITLFNQDGAEIGTATTGDNGVAFFADAKPNQYGFDGVMAQTGQSGEAGFGIAGSLWNQTISPWQFNVPYEPAPEQRLKSYLFTDRPIYRPGDTVYFNGILRRQDYGRYAVPTEQKMFLQIQEQNYYTENEPFFEELTLTTNPDGSFSGEFVLPEGSNPGSYEMFAQASGDTGYSTAFIQVAEFRKPEFEVNIEAAESDVLRGESAEVTVQADYFFGGSASDLQVNYTIFEETFNFGIAEPFLFSAQDRYFWEPYTPPYQNPIFSGSGITDKDGQLVINIPADLLANSEPGSRNVIVEATVFDVNFQPFSARTNLTFHAAEVYVGIQSDQYLVEAGDSANFSVITVDWDGEPLGNIAAEAILYKREWERSDNGWYEPVDTLVEGTAVQFTTDSAGRANLEYIISDGGTYKVEVTATDQGGRTHQSSSLVWVTGQNARWRIDAESKAMQLIPDKAEYAVGETARLLVQSPFETEQAAWLTIERGGVLEQQQIVLNGTADFVEIPITLDHLPNIFMTVTTIKPEQTGDSPYADMRLGLLNLPVKIDPFLLNVDITPRLPDSGLFEPGTTAEFDVSITNQNGQPVQGTLSIALVDKAIFSLASDSTSPIEEAFYSQQPLRSQTGATLSFSAEGYEQPEEIESGRGGGGEPEVAAMAADAVEEEAEFAMDSADEGAVARNAAAPVAQKSAESPPEGIEVRTDFRDTAFWETTLTTDGNGSAVISIPLPDNLTTWRLHAKTITGETLVNQTSSEITVQKPILVRPIFPRFFTVGDVAQVGTVVNNNTDQDVELNVLVEIEGGTFEGEPNGTLTVPANGSAIFRAPLRIDNRETDFVNATITVWNDTFSDASKPSFGVGPDQLIPVYRYNAEDVVATSGVLTDDQTRRVEAVLLPEGVDTDSGDIRFKLNGSLAAVVFEGLKVIERENIDLACAHSVAGRLMPNATTDRAITQLKLDKPDLAAQLAELIPTDIQALADAQRENGGWGWCYSKQTSPWFSAYVLLALDRAADAGYDIPADTLNSGLSYLESHTENPSRLGGNKWEANGQAFYQYVLAEHGRNNIDAVIELYNENKDNLDSYAKALLILALDAAEGDAITAQTIFADLNSSAFVSATGAHWEDDDYTNLSSDQRATAIVLMAFANADPSAPFAPQAVNWLMGARQAQVWRSYHDTGWVLTALTDWLVETGELDGDFSYGVALNGQDQIDGSFARANMTETVDQRIPVGQLNESEVNFFDFSRNGDGRLYYNAWLDTFIPADLVGPIDRGLSIERRYYDASCDSATEECLEISEIAAGQQVRVELTVIAKRDLVYAVIEDYFPAGAEANDPNLGSASQSAEDGITRTGDSYYWWGWWNFDRISYRDERVTFTSNFLPSGTYRYTYTLNAILPGEYQVRPTFGYEEFTPEVNGRAAGAVFKVTEE